MDLYSTKVSRRIFFTMLSVAGFSIQAFAQSLVTFKKSKLKIVSSKGENEFNVEVAINERQQSQGLMYRRSMAKNAGMLFDYGVLRHIQMWMKNTYIPLDMIFIDTKGKITSIVERTVPHSKSIISSNGRVRAVLELNSGTSSRLNLKPGDTVIHSIFR